MLTLKELFAGTAELRDKVNPTSSFGVTKVVPSPNLGNILAVQYRFNPLTDKSRSYYDSTIVFHGLEFTQTKDDEHPVGIEVFPGQVVYMAKPSFENTDVSVLCLCADYYYTWWYYTMRKRSHAGVALPAYTRKTAPPPVGMPFRNSSRSPGICKHLLRMTRDLRQKGFLEP